MKISLYLSLEMEKKLAAYREQRRIERGGKILQTQTAALELFEKALSGIEPKKVVDLEDMERRINRLEIVDFEGMERRINRLEDRVLFLISRVEDEV